MNSIKLCPFSSKVQICLECSKCILWKNSGDKPICTLRHPGSTIPFEPPSSPNIRLASGLWTDRNSLQQNIGLCQKNIRQRKRNFRAIFSNKSRQRHLHQSVSRLQSTSKAFNRFLSLFQRWKRLQPTRKLRNGRAAGAEWQDSSETLFCLIKPSIRAFIASSSALAASHFSLTQSNPNPPQKFEITITANSLRVFLINNQLQTKYNLLYISRTNRILFTLSLQQCNIIPLGTVRWIGITLPMTRRDNSTTNNV